MPIKKQFAVASLAGAVASFVFSFAAGGTGNIAIAISSALLGGIAAAYILKVTTRETSIYDALCTGAISGFLFIAALMVYSASLHGFAESLAPRQIDATESLASNAYIFAYAASSILAGTAGGLLLRRFYRSKTITKKK